MCALTSLTYPCQAADRGCALDIKWSRKRFKPELTYSPPTQETKEQDQRHLDNSFKNEPSSNNMETDKGTLYEINLNHSR